MRQARERLLVLVEQQALSVYDDAIKESLPMLREQHRERSNAAGLRQAERSATT